MKKLLLLLGSVAVAMSAFGANLKVETLGDGTIYSFEKLSQNDTTGVVKVDGGYNVVKDITIVAGDFFELDDNVVIKLGDRVCVQVKGGVKMDLIQGTTVTRLTAADEPEGFNIYASNTDEITCCNLSMEYAAIRFVVNTKVHITDCSFRYANGRLTSGGALGLGGENPMFVIENCEFSQNEVPGVSGGANIACGLLLQNCVFEDNNTKNSNRPQANITVGGNQPVEILNNTFIGAKRTKVGAIAVSNMLGIQGTNKVRIEGNTAKHHRYGITTNGMMDVVIKNNILEDNKYEENPMYGGSGISVYDTKLNQTVYIEGNTITDHFWGITLIGCKSANIGKTGNPAASDYNPGKNIFKNNGNGGNLYDLYNNGPNTVYAQGNTWNVDEQTAEKIETVITHKVDVPNLGEVIFMPDGAGVEDIAAGKAVFDRSAKQIVGLGEIDSVQVCSVSGAMSGDVLVEDGIADMSNLPTGIYVVKTGDGKAMKIQIY